MAKLTVIVTVLLLTFALSVVSSKPENEIIADKLATIPAEPDSDTKNPTVHGSGSGPELTSSDEITIPVNFVNFHPINRHFPRRPLTTTITFNRRPCHHRRHELLGRGVQIPYGKDMIFSGEEKATGADPSSDSVVVDIPAIKMLVGPFPAEETKNHPGRGMEYPGEIEAEEDGSMKITVTRVKLMKHKGGEGERENTFRTKIRKFLNHLV